MTARQYSSVAAPTTLTSAISASALTIPVTAITGYPPQYPFTLCLDPSTDDSPNPNEELVDVTGVSGLNFTLADSSARGVDGTSAVPHAVGARVVHVSSARDFRDMQSHIAATGSVHGTASNVVGINDNQTLTNKTLDTPFIYDFTNAQHDHTTAAAGGLIQQESVDGLSSALSSLAQSVTDALTTLASAQEALRSQSSYLASLAFPASHASYAPMPGLGTVTVTVPPSGVVLIESYSYVMLGGASSGVVNNGFVTYSMTGANTLTASDSNCVNVYWAGLSNQLMQPVLMKRKLTGLTPGDTTFTLQGRGDGGTSANLAFQYVSFILTPQP